MNKKQKLFSWISGIVLIMIVGLSSTMLASKSLLSAKEEVNKDEKVVEIIFPSKPFERIESSTTDSTKSTEDFVDIASNISLISVVPRDFPTNEPINESAIGTPFYLDLTFSLNGEALNSLKGKTFVYDVPNKYINAFSAPESTIIINEEKVGSISEINSGATSVEFKFDSTLPESLQMLEGDVEVTLKPVVRLNQELGYTSLDKRTDAVLKIENNDEIQNLAFTGYPFTILPHTPGAFDWLANAEDYGLTPPTLYGSSDYHWQEDNTLVASTFQAFLNKDSIRSKNPNYKGTIPDKGFPYYFFGMSNSPSEGGVYYPEIVAVCVDIFHSLIAGSGQKADLKDYVGEAAAAEVHYGIHMGAMLAEKEGNNIGLGMDVSRGQVTTSTIPIKWRGDATNQYNQKRYMFGGQLRAWLIAAQNNLNPAYRLDINYNDLDPHSSMGGWGPVDMDGTIKEIEDMVDEYKKMDYIDETPVGMKVGETKTIFTVPSNQEKFIHYVDYEASKGLDKVVLSDNVDKTTGVFKGSLSVTAKMAIAEGDVNIVIRKNTSDLWNSDLGYDSIFNETLQKKAVLSMPKAYQPTKTVSVFTEESDYSLEIQKTDDAGKALTGAEFELKAIDGSENPKRTESGNGKVEFSPLIPEVTYELSETKAPIGYQPKEDSYTIVMDKDGNLTVKEGTKTLIAGQDYTWDENNLSLSFSVENEKLKKEIILTKIDRETEQPLEGAVFIIQSYNAWVRNIWDNSYAPMGEPRKEFTTDVNGQIVINDTTYPGLIDQMINDYKKPAALYGTIQGYRFREIDAPKDYPDPGFNDSLRFEEANVGTGFSAVVNMDELLSNSKEELFYEVKNSKDIVLGNVEIIKYDATNSNKTLEGAEFSLYKKDGTLVQKDIETGSNGKVTIPNLALGEYYILETKAPNGYVTPEAPANRWDFKITEEKATAGTIEVVNVPNNQENIPLGKVKLYKYDGKDQSQGLDDAEFSLYKKDGTLLESKIKTNDQGIIERELPIGEYYFIETKAPGGYFLNGEKQPFRITEGSTTTEIPVDVEVSNIKAPPRELLLTKTDEETGEPIPGVVFIIQNLNGNTWEQVNYNDQGGDLTFTTNTQGQVVINETTHPGLINHLVELNDNPNVKGLRFREISTPEGWIDPHPTQAGRKDNVNDLYANDFAKDIPMDTLTGSPLSSDPIHVEVTKTNKKEETTSQIIRVEKRDKATGNLITDGEATFIIQSLRKDNQWSAFSDQQFTTQNGIAVIEDEELINDLLNFQGGENDQKYRFREIEAPEGYKDPQAPSPLSANEAPGGIGDGFSKEFTLGKENSSTVTVVIENEKPEDPVDRAVTLKKKDDSTDKALSGAEFEIEKYDAGSDTWKPTSIEKKTTGNSGLIELSEQEINSLGSDYPIYITFKEVTPPDGYEMPKNPYSETITITADGVTPESIVKENSRIEFEDRELKLKKVDGFTNLPLEGAEFELHHDFGDSTSRANNKIYTTNSRGEFEVPEEDLTELDYGDYVFKEVEAPDGYELPDVPFSDTFTISSAGINPEEIVMKNYKSGDVMLKKVDQNGKPVVGAEFDLYKYPGPGATGTPEKYYGGYSSDENGEITPTENQLRDMVNGVYFFRETKAPDGYDILEQDTAVFVFENGKANPNIIRHINQYDGRLLEFYKYDERGYIGDGLNGAVFQLEKENTPNNWQTVKKDGTDLTFTTSAVYDQDGDVEYSGTIYLGDQDIEKYGLTNGTYRFKEIVAPEGYELPTDPYTDKFVLSDKAIQPEEIRKQNSRLNDRNLTFKKVDGRDQNNGLVGAQFIFEYTSQYASDGDAWFTYEETIGKPVIFTTDENGEIIFDEAQLYDIFQVNDIQKQKGRFKEVKAPEGYLLPDDVYSEEFIIRATEITDLNERPITEIKKVNYKVIDNYELELLKVNDNEVRLDGAEFTLVPSDGSGQPQVSTGDKGIFNFKDLEPDVEYTLSETKAPDDYFINKTPYTFILRTDEDPDGILEVYYNGNLLEEGKDYEWNSTQLKLSLVMINRKSSMPITGSVGIIGLLIAGATAIGIAYNFQLKKKKAM